MKFIDIIKTAAGNLLRSKSRTTLTILAIFIGAFTITLTSGINTGVNGYLDQQVQNVGAENYMDVMVGDVSEGAMGGLLGDSEPDEYDPDKNGTEMETITDADVRKMKEIPGVESVSLYKSVNPEYVKSEKNGKKFLIVDGLLVSDNMRVDMKAGRLPKLESSAKPEVALSPGYGKLMGYGSEADLVGETAFIAVKNLVTGEVTEVEATVSGVQNASLVSRGRSWINAGVQEQLYAAATDGLPDKVKNQAYGAGLQFSKGLSEAEIQDIRDGLTEIGLTGMTVKDEIGMIQSVITAVSALLIIFGIIALLAASIGIVNTLFMSVQERTREIGLMKAMGLSRRKIFMQFTIEAIMLGFWGSAIGIGVSYIAKLIVNGVVIDKFFSELPSFTLVDYDPVILALIAAAVMLIAFLAGTLPARRASRLDAIEALRYE
ncbi:MAG: ABC transporter permease [Clostridiales Family XIII bacterium]|jgi:putative ABC transport system permease protein|nr:ABC transporter permease [Clostridiales Family XIII bacterium]